MMPKIVLLVIYPPPFSFSMATETTPWSKVIPRENWFVCLLFPDFKKYISIFQSCRNCTKYSQTIVFLLIGGLCTIKSYFPLGKKCCFRDWKVFWDTFSADDWKKSIINSCDIFVPLPTTIEPLDLTIWVEKKEGLLESFFVKIHPIFKASQQTKSLTRAFEFYYQNILDFRVLDFVLPHNVICLLEVFSKVLILLIFLRKMSSGMNSSLAWDSLERTLQSCWCLKIYRHERHFKNVETFFHLCIIDE